MNIKGCDIIELKNGQRYEVLDIKNDYIFLSNGDWVKRKDVVKVVKSPE